MKIQFLWALVFSAAAFAPRMNATEIVTTSYAAWTATVAGTPADWDLAFPNGGAYSTAQGYTLNVGSYGPVNVTGPDGSGYSLNENSSYFDSTTSQNVTTLEGASDGTGSLVFSTPSSGLTAFGLALGMVGTASPITVTLSDGETFTANPGVNGDEFLGFSSATAVTSFTLTTSDGSAVELVDFQAGDTGEPAPAAEVTPLLMVGGGLLAFLWRRKR
jgi:hypothetical protein